MSHSLKKKGKDDDTLQLSSDLKNYSRRDLLVLAKHYNISSTLNKERLTMEIAKANLERLRNQKAVMPPFVDNKQVLDTASTDCEESLDQLESDMKNTFEVIRAKRRELFETLRSALEDEPVVFEEILPYIVSACDDELSEISKCVGGALARTESTIPQTIENIQEILSELSPEEDVELAIASAPAQAAPRGPMDVLPASAPAQVEVTGSPEPILAKEKEKEEEEVTEWTPSGPPPLPDKESPSVILSRFFGEEKESPSVILSRFFGEEEETQVPPGLFGSEATRACESDEDCEALLRGLYPGQKVICVTKRDGSSDCTFKA